MEFNWRCSYKNVSDRQYLEQLLPRDYRYQVTSFQMLEGPAKIPTENKFTADIKISTCTVQGLFDFIKEFQGITSTTYNHGKNIDITTGKTVDLSGIRKCHHLVRKIKDKKEFLDA